MTATNEEKKPVGYLDLVRTNQNFRFLWTGQVVSLLGDWFDLIASAALISELTRSGLAIGGLFVVRMLSPFLVSPLAGVLADRYNRKKLLIIADVLRGFIVLGFLTVRTPGQAWLLYVITAIQLAFSGLFFPARNAIIPDIVTHAELGAANAPLSRSQCHQQHHLVSDAFPGCGSGRLGCGTMGHLSVIRGRLAFIFLFGIFYFSHPLHPRSG